LMFERGGGAGAGGPSQEVVDLAGLARRLPRDGKTAWDDPAVRQKIAEFASEARALK